MNFDTRLSACRKTILPQNGKHVEHNVVNLNTSNEKKKYESWLGLT